MPDEFDFYEFRTVRIILRDVSIHRLKLQPGHGLPVSQLGKFITVSASEVAELARFQYERACGCVDPSCIAFSASGL